MRVDQKAEGPRQSMSWLHTWASLILGWLLYAIFVTGTLSFFQNEISTWMKPETHQSIPAQSQVQQMQVALNYLQKNHPDAGSWNIQLPNSRQITTEVTIRAVGEDPKARRGGTRITLDSATGEVIEPRDTRGGGFLYRFHFELYGLPRLWTRWLVGIATMFMLVAIVSGIITHKKIFKDFFTFRSGKGQRSWLDAHNATAVFALPFHLMITFSGLLLLMFMFMPWGINQAYENRQQFLRDQQASMIEQPQKAEDVQREGRSQREGERTDRGERGQQRGEHAQGRGEERPQPELRPAPLTDLAPIMVAVQQQWKDNPIASINIISPNTDQAKIELRALRAESVAHRNVYATLNYKGVTGQDETDKNIRIKNPSIPSGIYNVATVLHEARGLDLALRWLLFCSGILGTLMVATGLILWCVKRAPQQQKQGYKSFGFRLVEVLNIAAIIGLPLACAAYFYANRFIPADVEMRLNWEIRSFFIVWLLTLIYAIFRTHRQAWLDLLLFPTLAFALLPVVNLMTGGQALWNSVGQGQWMIASVDLAMWVMAVIFYFAYDKVKKHQGLPNKKVKVPVQEAEA
ncbi:PepSY-associated TM helix domain-containing protein [Acinetobacter johnsonii]|uniref:Iron-regulated membrane protein n=1 Tax=Acinetobacter johnsonii TaxID=40214 RepID=A0AAV3WE90_ACIJO|nr:PepSY-associated TM helix domain-containing protein [Acinetobacter johnsonii]WQE00397.1 PepSY-associated TM helix domain-containing protein [Acinetobacter johnsonii]GEK44178.1 iron-regulated membrane protein [Acinetobacter johnsonii]